MKILIGSAKTLSKTDKTGITKPCFEKQMKTLLKNGFERYIKRKDKHQAIDYYDGLVFKYMKKDGWDEDDYQFAGEHILIISAMYGLLKPTDNILGYRLDFNMAGNDHYKYYRDIVNKKLKKELLINLASGEFAKLIDLKMINIKFIDDKSKSPSTMVKMARGTMINFLVRNRVDTIDGIKEFNKGFEFSKELSDDNNLIFRRVNL